MIKKPQIANRRTLLLLIAWSCILATNAKCALPTIASWQFNGTVKAVVNSTYESTPNPYRNAFAVGDAWTATFKINLDSPRTPNSGLGNCDQAVLDASLRFSKGTLFGIWAQDFMHIEYPSSYPQITMQYSSLTSINGFAPHIIQFDFSQWRIPMPTTLRDFANNFNLAAIGNPQAGIWAGSGPTHHLDLLITSAFVDVPEPPWQSLLALELFAAAAGRPRKR